MNNHWVKRNESSKLMVRLSCQGNGLLTTAKPLKEKVTWIVPLCIGYDFKFTGYQILRITERRKNGLFIYTHDKEVTLSTGPIKLKKGDEIVIEFCGDKCTAFEWMVK